MAEKHEMSPEEEEYLTDQLDRAHQEFHRMLMLWAKRDAHPLSVSVVFCTGLLCNLREFLEPSHYTYVVTKVLNAVEELTGEEGNDRTRNLH